MELELYNLDEDIPEKSNVAGQHPEIVKQMEKTMVREYVPAKSKRFQMKKLGD